MNVNPVSLSSVTIGTQWIDQTGQQWVVLTWSAQNATGFTITRDGTTITPPPPPCDQSELAAPLSNPPSSSAQETFTISALGYVTPNSTTTLSVPVSPLLQILDFSARPPAIVLNEEVTLSWNVIGFNAVSIFVLEEGEQVVIKYLRVRWGHERRGDAVEGWGYYLWDHGVRHGGRPPDPSRHR